MVTLDNAGITIQVDGSLKWYSVKNALNYIQEIKNLLRCNKICLNYTNTNKAIFNKLKIHSREYQNRRQFLSCG